MACIDTESDRMRQLRRTDVRLEGSTHVVRRDVTPVCPGVDGDARRARRDAYFDRVEDAWQVSAARVTKRRDLVDVDGKADHSKNTCTASSSPPRRPQGTRRIDPFGIR